MPELFLIVLLISLLLIATVRLFPLSPAPKSQTRVQRSGKRHRRYEYHGMNDYDDYE